ncbi:UbiA family prenyltransferase [Bowmanella denitrificans]|uniref:UbiA family prenyltransferase n=1 Tax=Bowmanella denitrificans TaxID=366582 RepID=A0ABP3HQ61_9ALTE
MTPHTFLTLTRASNLPSVWTNLLVGGSLGLVAGIQVHAPLWQWLTLLVAMSAIYMGGMLQNDAFDADWDKHHQNRRPIALGLARQTTVALLAKLFLAGALVLLMIQAWWSGHAQPALILLLAAALLFTIWSYNRWHKQQPHCAWLMGLCRVQVYLLAAGMLGQFSWMLAGCAAILAAYIASVTYLARNEHLANISLSPREHWPLLLLTAPLGVLTFSHPHWLLYPLLLLFCGWVIWHLKLSLLSQQAPLRKLIGALLAAISLIDALILAALNHPIASLACVGAFLLMPRLQRWVAAT